jgi:hypothetical protein
VGVHQRQLLSTSCTVGPLLCVSLLIVGHALGRRPLPALCYAHQKVLCKTSRHCLLLHLQASFDPNAIAALLHHSP